MTPRTTGREERPPCVRSSHRRRSRSRPRRGERRSNGGRLRRRHRERLWACGSVGGGRGGRGGELGERRRDGRSWGTRGLRGRWRCERKVRARARRPRRQDRRTHAGRRDQRCHGRRWLGCIARCARRRRTWLGSGPCAAIRRIPRHLRKLRGAGRSLWSRPQQPEHQSLSTENERRRDHQHLRPTKLHGVLTT